MDGRTGPPKAACNRIGQNKPLTMFALVRGLPLLVWQVLGSNQRRL